MRWKVLQLRHVITIAAAHANDTLSVLSAAEGQQCGGGEVRFRPGLRADFRLDTPNFVGAVLRTFSKLFLYNPKSVSPPFLFVYTRMHVKGTIHDYDSAFQRYSVILHEIQTCPINTGDTWEMPVDTGSSTLWFDTGEQ